jgi:hypothetical protein
LNQQLRHLQSPCHGRKHQRGGAILWWAGVLLTRILVQDLTDTTDVTWNLKKNDTYDMWKCCLIIHGCIGWIYPCYKAIIKMIVKIAHTNRLIDVTSVQKIDTHDMWKCCLIIHGCIGWIYQCYEEKWL